MSCQRQLKNGLILILLSALYGCGSGGPSGPSDGADQTLMNRNTGAFYRAANLLRYASICYCLNLPQSTHAHYNRVDGLGVDDGLDGWSGSTIGDIQYLDCHIPALGLGTGLV